MDRIVVSIIFMIVLSGCASKIVAPPYIADQTLLDDAGELVIYRPYKFVGGFVSSPVLIDGKLVSYIPNDGLIQIKLKPGKHQVQVMSPDPWWPESMWKEHYSMGIRDVNVESGQTQYIRLEMGMSNEHVMVVGGIGTFTADFGFSIMPVKEIDAVNELSCCSLVNLD